MEQEKKQMTHSETITQDSDEPTWRLLRPMPLKPYSISINPISTRQTQLFLYLPPESRGISNWDTLSDVESVVITYWTTRKDGI